MTPADYRAAKSRLGLTHEALAALIGVEPQTSRVYAMRGLSDEPTIRLLRIVERIGVDKIKRILAPEPG